MNDPLHDLITRWRRDAAQYQRQIDEARSKGLPCECTLGLVTALKACAMDLERQLPLNVPPTPLSNLP